MKKLLLALSLVGLFGLSACVVEDDCECIYGEGGICLNSIDLADSCENDCDWDVIDCEAFCLTDITSIGGYCSDAAGDCICEY